MAEDRNQPREGDAVLGGAAGTPAGAAVLGGIEGVEKRLGCGNIEQQKAALKDAFKYGEAGLDLAIACLQHESWQVRWEAYSLLQKRTEVKVIQALQEYIPPLRCTSGFDYSRLLDFLASGCWKLADEETRTLMLRAVGREYLGFFRRVHVQKFPAEDLRLIDYLWVKYSEGRWGFSVQKRIWEGVGGRENIAGEPYERFRDSVGWQYASRYEYLTFKTTAPSGHLPSILKIAELTWWGRWELVLDVEVFSAFMTRVTEWGC